MTLLELRKKAYSLPLRPGVYQMKNSEGTVIYVGKAKKLRNRVSSYFINEGSHGIKTETMISHVHDFEVIITSSEWEALVLENTLIKHYMPRYNILLKDDKGYPFIRADFRQQYVKFEIVSKREDDGARYFGPYRSRTLAHEVMSLIHELFKLPTCKRSFPKDIGKSRPCLDFQLGKCMGVCTGNIAYEEYRALLDQAVMLLEGHFDDLTSKLQSQMEAEAEELHFEAAAKIRDRLRALIKIKNKQKVVAAKAPDTDIAAFYAGSVKSCAAVLHYVDGTLYSKDYEIMDAADESEGSGIMEDYLRQFYAEAAMIPREIIVQPLPEDIEMLTQWIEGIAGHPVKITGPGRDKKRFITMAYVNARDEAERTVTKSERQSKTAMLLKNMLTLDKEPKRIEAYDISNTAGGEIVGGMVVFEDCKPKRNSYRKFKIEGLSGQDDYGAMEQMLTRRFKRYIDNDEKFNKMPDLLLIDGGVGHVRAVRKALSDIGISCEIRGMVKDDRHRTRAIVDENGMEAGIQANTTVYSFIGTIQEEVHRFAITYHRSLRDKNDIGSQLDKIPGVGPKRRDLLLQKYKSIQTIETAPEAELATLVGNSVAASIFRYFHNNGEEE